MINNPICNRQFGGSIRDCVQCRVPGGWLECPPEARGILVPASVAAAMQEPPPINAFAPAPQTAPPPPPPPPPRSRADQYAEARAAGFTGDLCGNCGSAKMTRNGTCLKCMDCGETSGCS